MSSASTHRARGTGGFAGFVVAGLCAIAAAAGPALAHPGRLATGDAKGKTVTLRYYSVVVSLVYTSPDGTVASHPPRAPEAGGRLDIIELGYKGTHASHARKWSSSAHTVCIFTTAKGEPTCEGHAAIGGNQMLFFRTPPGSGPVVSGGTGAYLNATGGVTATEVGDTNNSDVAITIHLVK